MNFIEKWDRWASDRQSIFIDLLRVLLGLFIFYKGLFFMQNSQLLINVMSPVDPEFNSVWLVHYVAMSHLAGGLFIAIGLLTRLASVIQVPILAVAVVFNLMGPSESMETLQSVLALILLLLFTFYGSGRRSVDRFFSIGVPK